MSLSFVILNAIFAIVSLSGAAFAYLKYYALENRVEGLNGQIKRLHSREGMDQQKIRDEVDDYLNRKDLNTNESGMDIESMMMMMGMNAGGQQPPAQPPAQPRAEPTPEEELDNEPENAEDGGGETILDTIQNHTSE